MSDYLKGYNGKTILVTGGAGSIGSNLTRALIESEVKKVVVLDDLSAAEKWNIPVAPSVPLLRAAYWMKRY